MKKFITFEGGDGAGKSTLIDKVYDYLQTRGLNVLKTRAPGATEIGAAIRELLLHKKEIPLVPRCELLLFLADRAQHVEEVIVPALERGQIVICDRFNDSTRAYQAGARGLDDKQVRDLCLFACNQVQPELTIYLDIDPEIALKRIPGRADRMEAESLVFHQKIRRAFHKIAESEPKRFRIINAEPAPEIVFDQARELIDALL